MNKKYISVALGTAAGISMIIPAFAQNAPTTNNGMQKGRPNHQQNTKRDGENGSNQNEKGKGFGNGQMMTRPVVSGTVTLIAGNTITISGHQGMASSSAPLTTFVIDATNAKIMKANVAGTITSVVVGDTVVVSGTLTGTNVVATMIRDGVMMDRGGEGRGMMNNTNSANAQAMQQLQGNGQPVIAGTITAINGTSVTITNKSNVTYTAETSAAKVIIAGTASTIASAKVGDMVIVQGTINGTAITASSVIDNGTVPTTTTNTQPVQNTNKVGFFGGIGGFFGKMFGF